MTYQLLGSAIGTSSSVARAALMALSRYSVHDGSFVKLGQDPSLLTHGLAHSIPVLAMVQAPELRKSGVGAMLALGVGDSGNELEPAEFVSSGAERTRSTKASANIRHR